MVSKHQGINRVVATAWLLGMGVFFAYSQSEKKASDQKTLQHDAEAVIKLITVRVLDQAGHPVTDLNREDFILYDNGIEHKITEFEIHSLSEKGMMVRPGSSPEIKAESRPGMNRRLFIFLDMQGSDINGMANAKQAALHFVDNQLRPDDEVGVLAFSPMRGFLIREYLTTDHIKIRKAIVKSRELPPSKGRFEAGMWVPGTDIYQRRDFVPHMTDLALAMKHIPGNKSLILFTGRNLGPISAVRGKAFAGSGIPVYPVNTQDWVIHRIIRLSIKRKHIWNEHPLKELASISGGKYFADIHDIETISRDVQILTGNYYVLGYYVTENWDGKYHQLNVAVDRPGVEVLVQDGYFSQKPYSERSNFEKQLDLWNLIYTENPASIGLPYIPMESLRVTSRKKSAHLFIAQMTVDPKAGAPPAKMEVFVLLRDKDRKQVLSRQSRVDFSKYEDSTLYPYFITELTPDTYECRIIVRDIFTGRAAVGICTVSVPEKKDSEIRLFSPLLFTEGVESVFVRMSDKKSKKDEKQTSILDYYRLFPKGRRLILKDIEEGTRILCVVQPVIYQHSSPFEIDLKVGLSSVADSGPVDLNAQITDVKRINANFEVFMIKIGLPELKPGEYELELIATAKETQASSSISKLLIIK